MVLRTTALNSAADYTFLQDSDRRTASAIDRVLRAEQRVEELDKINSPGGKLFSSSCSSSESTKDEYAAKSYSARIARTWNAPARTRSRIDTFLVGTKEEP